MASPPIPEHWNLCHISHEFDKAVLRDAENSTSETVPSRASIRRRVEFAKPDTTPVAGAPGDCLLGELTDLGRESMLKIGQAIRRVYIDQLHFLPEQLRSEDAQLLYLRSTNVARTMQSMDQVITGLMGPFMNLPGALVPQVLVRNTSQEDMLPNSRPCPQLGQLMHKFAKQAAFIYNPRLEALDVHIAPHNSGNGPRVDGRPRLSGLIDTARAALAHGIPTPLPFLNEEIMQQMEEAVLHEWFAGYQTQNHTERVQYRRLAMSELLSSLYGRFSNRIEQEDNPLKLSIYLGHDATLIGMLHCLDCFNGKWPDFGASISWELFQDRGTKSTASLGGSAYVRCRYGDETLRLSACAPEGRHFPGHPEFCSLAAFREVVVDRLRHPDNVSLEEECKIPSVLSTN